MISKFLLLGLITFCVSCTKPPENDRSKTITIPQEDPSASTTAELSASVEKVQTEYTRFLSMMGETKSVPSTLDWNLPDKQILAEGERLSANTCGVCHLLPPPSSIKKSTWITIFHMMRSGFWAHKIMERPAGEGHAVTDPTRGFFPIVAGRVNLWDAPKKFQVSIADFTKVFYYYMITAPLTSVPQQAKPAYGKEAPFNVIFASETSQPNNQTYSLAYINEARGHIIIGQANEPALIWLDASGKVLRKEPLQGIPTGILVRGGSYHVTMIGPGMYSDDLVDGAVVRIPWDTERLGPSQMIADHLERPIMIDYADLDADGMEDFVISEFGLYTGALSWHRTVSPGKVEIRKIFDGPGVVGARMFDFDNDGLLDVVTAIAQADEEIVLFNNKGKGRFEKRVLAKAEPGFGLNSIHLADIDGDGDMDILSVNGDDYAVTREARNSHGIRVFENLGKLDFKVHFIYPMYGALQLVTSDFDSDGDLDIAAISRFADITASPPETFVYLENGGGFNFIPRRVPKAETGRWLAISAGDIDRNGAPDLVLAAFEPPGEPGIELWDKAFARKKRPGYIFLQNLTKPKKVPEPTGQ